MAYLGVVEAVIARLQGKPKTFVPELPKLPNHAITGSAELESQFRPKAYIGIVKTQVPIYYLDPSGRDVKKLYPCFTFNVIDFTPRYDEYVFNSKTYNGDYASFSVSPSKADVEDVDENGNPVTLRGDMLMGRRPVMHPYDIMVEIRALCDDDTLSAFMVEHVYANVFEPRDFLRVPMKDGSQRSWDVLFQSFRDLDSRQAVRAGTPGIERQYQKVWTYKIEGYLDNTDKTVLVNVIKARKIDVNML